MIATEWSLKKTALLFNHATHLMDQEPGSGAKGKQKADTVHQGALSMLNEHKNLLHLDEELRKLKRPDNTKRDKKKIQAMEDAMQAKITELKKQMDVNTTQLDSSSVQALINTIMPQHDAGEGCSGEKGPDKEDSEAEESDSGRSPENCLAKTVQRKRKVNEKATVAAQMRIVVALIITVQTERRVSGTATATTRASKVRESAKKSLILESLFLPTWEVRFVL